jgi:hypothetical protein
VATWKLRRLQSVQLSGTQNASIDQAAEQTNQFFKVLDHGGAERTTSKATIVASIRPTFGSVELGDILVMMIWRILAIAALSLPIGLVAACQKPVLTHKLVVTGNHHAVPLYSDEQTYLEVSHEKQQGGVEGMAGDVRSKFSAREIDDQTAVKVVSSDDNGAVIDITEGPMKGQSGFVAKQNLD